MVPLYTFVVIKSCQINPFPQLNLKKKEKKHIFELSPTLKPHFTETRYYGHFPWPPQCLYLRALTVLHQMSLQWCKTSIPENTKITTELLFKAKKPKLSVCFVLRGNKNTSLEFCLMPYKILIQLWVYKLKIKCYRNCNRERRRLP